MPRKKLSTVWPALPHTIAKIQILQSYLVAWFQILGRTRRSQDILYVDGFAGPGEYTNYAIGSPLAALNAAKQAMELTGPSWIAGKIHCAFIEADRARFTYLAQRISAEPQHRSIVIHPYQMTFTDGLEQLRNDVPKPFLAQYPLFAFIDPFGATGVPFSVVEGLLSSPCSEVLINLDADGIGRIFHAGEHASHELHLNLIFKGDQWKGILDTTDSASVLNRKVLHLYTARLREIDKVRYVFSFEMRTSLTALNYYLVFASQHHLGLEKMKEAMKRIDQAGDYSFSDALTAQSPLFRFDDPAEHSLTIYNAFRGKKVKYSDVRDVALNETPFTNPKSMLRDLECNKDLIEEVKSSDSKRQKGTFNEAKIIYIKFK